MREKMKQKKLSTQNFKKLLFASGLLLLAPSLFSKPARAEDSEFPKFDCFNAVQTAMNALDKKAKLNTQLGLTSVSNLEKLAPSARRQILSSLSPTNSKEPEILKALTVQIGCLGFKFNGLNFTINEATDHSVQGIAHYTDPNGNHHNIQLKIEKISDHQLNFQIKGPLSYSVPGLKREKNTPSNCSGVIEKAEISYGLTWTEDGTEPTLPAVSDELLTQAGRTFSEINTPTDPCRPVTENPFKKVGDGGSSTGFEGAIGSKEIITHGEKEAERAY